MKTKIIHRIYDKELTVKFATVWNFNSEKIATDILKENYRFVKNNKKYTDINFTDESLSYKDGDERNQLYIVKEVK